MNTPRRYELTDFEWSIIEPLLPNKPRAGGCAVLAAHVRTRAEPVAVPGFSIPAAANDDGLPIVSATASAPAEQRPLWPLGVLAGIAAINLTWVAALLWLLGSLLKLW
jgi:hypothetical protein